jgi:glycosyltransferase involved in cell wall biosynthesis
MRIAIVYDCLYPHTVGGAERWYRNLADRLSQSHDVVYLTREQWGSAGPGTRFEAIAVAPGGALYTRSGRRRVWPALRFGWGVFLHLLRNPGYDAVHSASFPYFSLLGAAAALRLRRSGARLVVDWHEYWSPEYWRRYLGAIGGRAGAAVQALCGGLPGRSFTFSRLVEGRLRDAGHRAPVTVLRGQYEATAGAPAPDPGASREPLVVFAGRHIPEKRAPAVPAAIAAARDSVPALRGLILGEGPDTEAVRGLVRELGLDGVVEVRGGVSGPEVSEALAAAACLLHPSEREGYGLVVVEAAAVATPVIVTAGPENASVEMVEEGRNGVVAPGPDAESLSAAIIRVIEAGEGMRRTTAEWFAEREAELSLDASLGAVEAAYAGSAPP